MVERAWIMSGDFGSLVRRQSGKGCAVPTPLIDPTLTVTSGSPEAPQGVSGRSLGQGLPGNASAATTNVSLRGHGVA